MKHQGWSKVLLVSILAGAAVRPAHAFVQTDPGSELFVTGTASVQENDNLFLSHSNAKSDTVFDLTPGLEWDFGKNSANTGKLTAGTDFQVFTSESALNTSLPSAALTDTYDDTKTKVVIDA